MKVSVREGSPWLVLRHVEQEHMGTIARALKQAKQSYGYLDLYRDGRLPESLDGYRGLIVMGGPMGVYETEKYPFLQGEQRLIQQATQRGLPALGICLGAQLIASALGARVYPGPKKEIGWYPVEITTQDDLTVDLPSRFLAFHWHGDTFDLPAGAVRLFRSELYENQGFRYGSNVYAIQFHFEITAAMIDDWLRDPGCQAEIASLPEVMPAAIREQTAQWVAKLEEHAGKVFARFLAKAGGDESF